MLRLVTFLIIVAAIAAGLSWLADRPGNLLITWEGYEIETSVFRAVVMLAITLAAILVTWSLLRQIWQSPALVGRFFSDRRQKRGLDALSSGMIAIGAGDRAMAARYALQARKSIPNEPLTHLLRAQAAQLSGDKVTARRIFEAMLGAPDTEQLGLRGLFLEAQREHEWEAAQQFAERALRLNPKLAWPADALFELQCQNASWDGALDTLAMARRHNHVAKLTAERRRAVLLTAQAQLVEDSDPERALNAALEAHHLASDLVPAAAIAGRLLASRGNTPRATKIIQRTWLRAPHPELAVAYAYARLGDSPRDRLERVQQLTALTPNSIESPLAEATAAIEAQAYDTARKALERLMDGRLTQRACLLMARVEGEQLGDKGRVREWLARAVNAQRDAAWTADGVVADQWAPVSPVTGALDAFQWRAPVNTVDKADSDQLSRKLEELVALGAPASDELVPAVITGTVVREAPTQAGPRPDGETAGHTERPAADIAEGKAYTVDREPANRPAAPGAEPRSSDAAALTAAPQDPSASATSASADRTTVDLATSADLSGTTKPVSSGDSRVRDRAAGPAVVTTAATQRALGRQPGAPGPANDRAAGGPRASTAPKIFVAPRAPDDPGPETSDSSDASDALSATRAT